jgi:hypothetical protein
MKYRRIDLNGDYVFGGGAQNFLTDLDAIRQAVQTRLLLLYGEWWEDLTSGLPLFQSIINQFNVETVKNGAENLISKEILSVEGVQSVKNIEIDLKLRRFSYYAEIDTIYGETEIEVSN